MEVPSSCHLCTQGIAHKEKGFERVKIEVCEKEKENLKSCFISSAIIIVKHRNLQCLFICSDVFNNSTSSPHSYLLKKYQVDAKGHSHSSSQLPHRGKQSLDSFRKTKGGGEPGFLASLSFLSDGLEMYYYANVNFDTELKKRLLDFFFLFSKKKKGPYVVIIASLFCNVNCNYAFCKRGEEGSGEEGCFESLFSSFCVHGIPTSWREGE